MSSHILAGYAATFGRWYTLYSGQDVTIRERIMPGAFREALKENQDVRLLYNHNRDYLLARTASNTLRLREDDRGLAVRGKLLDAQWVRDRIILPAQRGDLNQMSFAYLPRPGGETKTKRYEGEITIYEYEITSVNLYEVSVVTVPANPDTRFNVRSAAPEDHKRSMLLRYIDARMSGVE